jgi:3-deoxy-D-manno-octulosonic-acid transferase
MLSSVYRLATDLGAPVIGLYLWKRRVGGREDKRRFRERLGHASQPRPLGRLIWCHAASVGEAASLLALIERLRTLYPETHILVTTGTVTSARILENRLPPGVIHQYIPVDRISYARRFLDHWRPDLALWIESELWPNMLYSMRGRGMPAVLLNGRMSEASFRKWRMARGWAREILGAFALCLTQSNDESVRFTSLGAKSVRCIGNLKYAATPLPVDEEALDSLQKNVADRPVWGFISTHRGEDELALEVHKQLASQGPNLLTVIVPRHAVRGDEIAQFIRKAGISCAQRSKGEVIVPQTAIYLADTMGELGLFYRLCAVVAIGGSFTPVGGHNPIEAAQLGCAIIFGPHMHNFSDIAREFIAKDAAIPLRHPNELATIVGRLLGASDERARIANAAHTLVDEKHAVLDTVIAALLPWLGRPSDMENRRSGT